MGVFKKTKKPEETGVGRRRPTYDDTTLSQRSNNQIFSYHSRRSVEPGNVGRREPLNQADQHTTRHIRLSSPRRTLMSLAAVITLLAIGYFSILQADPKIYLKQTDTSGYFLQSSNVYRQAVSRTLGSSLLNRSKLTVDTSAIRLELLKTYPEIKEVTVRLPVFGRQPQVYVEPYKPAFIVTTTNQQAFLLDETGRALASSSQVTNIDALGLATVQDKSGAAATLGARALPSTTVSFITTIANALRAKSVVAASMTLPANTSELDIAVEDQPYIVKFNLQNDALTQAGTYLAVRNRLQIQKVIPAQYVDVRVPERAYYK